MENERVISCRDVNEWIIGCPIRITNVSIISCDDGGIITSVESDVCGDFEKLSYTAIVEYKNTLKETVFKRNNVTLESGGSKFAEKIEARVAYASVTVQSVSDGDRVIWTGEDATVPQTLPDQEILWQTDQHYGVIKKECDGVTTAKYIPDTIDGAWRCTCGGLNLESSGKCGICGVEREWLTSHFDREYLENKKAEYALLGEKGKKKVKPKKKKEKPKVPAWIISAGVIVTLAAVITLAVLIFTSFIPQARYNKAISLAESGDFDSALRIFYDLGDFSDSAEMAQRTVYKKAQVMTGIDDVYVATSEELPWFEITEDGVLSFSDTDYKGGWDEIVIPDVFDGVIVKELSRNFFINCDELVSVVMSDCTEVIGEQAFYNCKKLEKIYFSASLTTIMPRAFINCHSLSELTIPDTVESIGARAFNNCTGIKTVELGCGIREISSYLFSNCTLLQSITLNSPAERIEEYAFSDCSSLCDIFCRFSESEYSPEIEAENEPFINATKHFDE